MVSEYIGLAIISTLIAGVISFPLIIYQLFIIGFGDGTGGGLDDHSLVCKWLYSLRIALIFGAICSLIFGVLQWFFGALPSSRFWYVAIVFGVDTLVWWLLGLAISCSVRFNR